MIFLILCKNLDSSQPCSILLTHLVGALWVCGLCLSPRTLDTSCVAPATLLRPGLGETPQEAGQRPTWALRKMGERGQVLL